MAQIHRTARSGAHTLAVRKRRNAPHDGRNREARRAERNGYAPDGRSGERYRQTLLVLRARLSGEVRQMAENALNGPTGVVASPMDIAEAASDTLQQELTLSFLGNQSKTLQKIEAALQRLDDGSYGTCVDCREPIPPARLGAIPYTDFCVSCAGRYERNG